MGRKAWLSLAIVSIVILGLFYRKSSAPFASEANDDQHSETNGGSEEWTSRSSSSASRSASAQADSETGESAAEQSGESAAAALSPQEQHPLLIEDEGKFRNWMKSYASLQGMGYLVAMSDRVKSRRITEDLCLQGLYQTTLSVPGGPDPAPLLKLTLDICLGPAAAERSNTADLTILDGTATRRPIVSPSKGGMPSGFRLIQHEGPISILVRNGPDIFQFFFFKASEQAMVIWYELDASMDLLKKGTFDLIKSGK